MSQFFINAEDNIIKIQRTYRAYKFSILANEKIVHIQRVTRGFLVRISERYILFKIYSKIPLFWKEIIQLKPKPVKRLWEKDDTSLKEIQQVLDNTSSTIAQITITRNGKVPYGKSIMPFWLPSAFDGAPYISLYDGRHIDFYGNTNPNHTSQQENSIHQFPLHLWPAKPLAKSKALLSPKIDVYDPHEFTFDIHEQARQVLLCERCNCRFRLIQCATCRLGFCFPCAIRIHSVTACRKHDLQLLNPQVKSTRVTETSLLYHIDIANQTSHELRYIAKNMHNRSEVLRIKKEKALKIEMEHQEKMRQIAIKKALLEDQTKHLAANRIASLFYYHRVQINIKEKQQLKNLNIYLHQKKLLLHAVVLIQKRFRIYSTMKCQFVKKSSHSTINSNRKLKRQYTAANLNQVEKIIDVENRLQYEIHQRRLIERANVVSKMTTKYNALCQLLTTNINYWLEYAVKVPISVEVLQQRKQSFEKKYQHIIQLNTVISSQNSSSSKQSHKNRSGKNSTGSTKIRKTSLNSTSKYTTVLDAQTELELKGIRLAIANVEHLIENYSLQLYWISQCIRANCRRVSIVKERFIDLCHRLHWISDEASVLHRLLFHCKQRCRRLESSLDTKLAFEWMNEHIQYILQLQISYDAQQESLLLEEISSLAHDEEITIEMDVLLKNLIDSVQQESQFSAEKVYLDRILLTSVVKGSDEAVRYTDQAYELKKKISNIVNNVMDSLKLALQNKLNIEDELNISIAGFPTDDPKLAIADMPSTIQAVLINKFKPTSHCTIQEFLNVYYIQPWLCLQAVEDVRMEDDILLKELDVESKQLELNNLKNLIREEAEACKEVEGQLEDLQEELDFIVLEPPKTMFRNRNDEDVAELIKQDTILLLKNEFKLKTMQRDQIEFKMEKMKSLIGPASERIQIAINEILQCKEILVKKSIERKRLEGMFYAMEEMVCSELIPLINGEGQRTKHILQNTIEKSKICEKYLNDNEEYSSATMLLIEYSALGLPKYLYSIESNIQHCNSLLQPRIVCDNISYHHILLTTRKNIYQLDIQHYEYLNEQLRNESVYIQNFRQQKKTSESLLQAFQLNLYTQMRQKSIQVELNERKSRLEALRLIRIEIMKQDREKILAKKERAMNRHALRITTQIKNSKVVRQVNQFREKFNQVKNKLISSVLGKEEPMDEEQKKMLDLIENNGKENMEDKPQAIRNIKITVGNEETELFTRQMEVLIAKKLPYYTRQTKIIGRQIALWCQYTYDVQQFITSLDMSHIDVDHVHYKDLTSIGYEAIGHPAMKLLFWVKRDPTKLTGITAIDFAFTEIEEKQLASSGYEMIGTSLFDFDLADITCWVLKVEKVLKKVSKMNTAVATNSAIHQLYKVRQLMQEHPENQNLPILEKKLISDLEDCYKKEEYAIVENPITIAKRLMALDNFELEQWLDTFEKIDISKTGKLKIENIFEYLGEYMTNTGKLVFSSMNAIDEEGYVEFGDFLLGIGTFCFFGSEEILKFLYTSADKENKGIIVQSDYVDLLNDLHPFDKSRAIRALKVQKTRANEEINFDEFCKNHNKFPGMLFPLYRLQNEMRAKILGEAWWRRKLLKYEATRDRLVKEASALDRKAELELKAFDENEAKKKRMDDRARAMLQETSAVKLAILNARQFTDALN